MFEIQVPLGERGYSIIVGKGESAANPKLKNILGASTRVFLVTNRTIWKIYSRQLCGKHQVFSKAIPLLIPDGERFKNLKWYENLCRGLVRQGVDRRSLIVALGGGVVGDVAGFVAATVLRGIRYVQLPTTLLAQIDSSIGGKTAVNLPEGKNLVGAFHQPSLVISDPLFLKTLPAREVRAGIYEAIKVGIILDRGLFEILEGQMARVLDLEPEVLEKVIQHCASAKAAVVVEDEREAGARKLLNFGHTIGHALEAITGYRRFKHGEAVGWGILVAVRLAEKMGSISGEDSDRMMNCVRSVGVLPKIADLKVADILRHMKRDKKAVAGELHWALPTGIGCGKVVKGADVTLVRESYLEIQKESRIRW
jgi:3-dehydroquinate synthase